MRPALLVSVLALGAGAALPACSALGLADLPQSDCVQGSGGVSGDPYCTSLSTLVPLPDACHTWQCNEHSHHCEQLPRDDDGDGYPSMMCAGSATADCDDANPDNHPDGTETCDGRDQNCDGIADDGAIAPPATAESSLTTLTGSPAVTMTSQPDADQAWVMAGYTPARFDAITVEGTAMPADLSFHQGSTALAPTTEQLAITGIGGMHYAIAARVATGACQQWGVFPVASGTSAITLRATDSFLLPACPAPAGTAQQITAAAVAGVRNGAAGDLIAVAWLSGADDERTCGAAPARDVVVSGASFDYRASGAFNRVSADVITLGQSVGNGPPVIVAVGDAFVVAYPRADDTIAVHIVSLTIDTTGVHVTAMAAPDYSEPAAAATPQYVALAAAPAAADGSATFALAWTSDCTATNTITARLITRHGTTLSASAPATGLGSGRGLAFVSVAYQPRVTEWLVAWRSSTGQSAQRLHDDGTPEGDPFLLRGMGVPEYTIEPLTTGPLYRAIVRDQTALSQIPFGCAPAAH